MDSFEEYTDTMDRIQKRIMVISEKHRDRHNNFKKTMQILSNAYGFNKHTIDALNHDMSLIMNCYEEMIEALKEMATTQVECGEHLQSEAIKMREKFKEFTGEEV